MNRDFSQDGVVSICTIVMDVLYEIYSRKSSLFIKFINLCTFLSINQSILVWFGFFV